MGILGQQIYGSFVANSKFHGVHWQRINSKSFQSFQHLSQLLKYAVIFQAKITIAHNACFVAKVAWNTYSLEFLDLKSNLTSLT